MRDAAHSGQGITLVTPEHVTLRFGLAELGTRAVALALDLLLIYLSATLLALGAYLMAIFTGEIALAVLVLVGFLLRVAYFPVCELLMQGQTIGKRIVGIRVVARDGGPLTAMILFARSISRELEIFLPLTAVVLANDVLPGAPIWIRLASSVWILIFGLLPFLNREHARVGDFIAGTRVVRKPEAHLLPDMADESSDKPVRFVFTEEQLGIYGIKELQVLEQILRQQPEHRSADLLQAVTDKICKKIGWKWPLKARDQEAFLFEFYRQQRADLEKRMVMGQRRDSKIR